MKIGIKIALWVGIPLVVSAVGYVLYKNKKQSIELVSYNPATKSANLKVQGKPITFKIEKGIGMMVGGSWSIVPLYGNMEDESTLYGVALENGGVTYNEVTF